MRKEIEVKARAKDMDAIITKLLELGCAISAPVVQHDTIFVDDNYGAFEEFQPGKNLLRIRESEGKYIFTLKNPQSNEQDSFEHETEIVDPSEMKAALLMMGYHEAVQVRKIRRKSHYQKWEICLDEIEGLGSFIELEEIIDDGDVTTIQSAMFEFMKTLGVGPEDRVTQGYDTLVYLHKKNG